MSDVFSGVKLRLPAYVYDVLLQDAQSLGMSFADYVSKVLVSIVDPGFDCSYLS